MCAREGGSISNLASSLVLSLGARCRRPRSFDIFQNRHAVSVRAICCATIRDGGGGALAWRKGSWEARPSGSRRGPPLVADAIEGVGVSKVEDLDPTSNARSPKYFRSSMTRPSAGRRRSSQGDLARPIQPGPLHSRSRQAGGRRLSDNNLIHLKHAVIMGTPRGDDGHPPSGSRRGWTISTAPRNSSTSSPSRLVADRGYAFTHNLDDRVARSDERRGIEPHVKLMDKSERTDGPRRSAHPA